MTLRPAKLQYLLSSIANAIQKSSEVTLETMRTVDNGKLEPAGCFLPFLWMDCPEMQLFIWHLGSWSQDMNQPIVLDTKHLISQKYYVVLLCIDLCSSFNSLPPHASKVALPNKVVVPKLLCMCCFI